MTIVRGTLRYNWGGVESANQVIENMISTKKWTSSVYKSRRVLHAGIKRNPYDGDDLWLEKNKAVFKGCISKQ